MKRIQKHPIIAFAAFAFFTAACEKNHSESVRPTTSTDLRLQSEYTLNSEHLGSLQAENRKLQLQHGKIESLRDEIQHLDKVIISKDLELKELRKSILEIKNEMIKYQL